MSPTVHCKYKYFDSTVQRAEDRRQRFYFCRLPFAVNVKLNLTSDRYPKPSNWALHEAEFSHLLYLAYVNKNYTTTRHIIALKTNGKIKPEYGKLLKLSSLKEARKGFFVDVVFAKR